MRPFDGLATNLANLSRLSKARSRAISPSAPHAPLPGCDDLEVN